MFPIRKDEPASPVHAAPQVADEQAEATLFSRLLAFDGGERPSWLWLVVEGLLLTLVGIQMARLLAGNAAGVVSVFLAAAALTHRAHALLLENRDDIHRHRLAPGVANRRSAGRLTALFAGIAAAYVVATALMGEDGAALRFGFVLEATGIGSDGLAGRRFGEFTGLLLHNLLVLGTFFVLSFLYRAYGALLAVAWNSATWGVALTLLVLRSSSRAEDPWLHAALAAAVLLPHLALEAFAYVLAALAGNFASRAVTRYAPADPLFRRVLRTSVLLVATGAIALGVAAGVESEIAPRLLIRLGG